MQGCAHFLPLFSTLLLRFGHTPKKLHLGVDTQDDSSYTVVSVVKQHGANDMYTAKISQDATGMFFAMVIRTDYDGQKQVAFNYKARYFKTRKAAEKSTNAYIAKR